jgi:uncharacterized protein YjbI with pentapeptide repeats
VTAEERAVAERLSYEDSCRRLHALGLADGDPPPPLPDHKPRYDDKEPLGVTFFRTRIEGDLCGLSLPRTFFGRSEICEASFRGTDLHESTLCWNDFVDVDFGEAVLSDADLRASVFERVSFVGTDLRAADLRHAAFTDCSFERASMKGAILTREQAKGLSLSASQIADIKWAADDGPEPDGG